MSRPLRSYCLTLLALMLALLLLFPVTHRGDVDEYALTTMAVAAHGTPDIRAADIALGKATMPDRAGVLALLETSMQTPGATIYPAFARGANGKIYPIHFFGYSLLAAAPYKLLALAGLPPLKAFQVLNLAAVFVLGLAMWRAFGSAARAYAGMALFALCGGLLFWTWTSPECLTAAALLAGLLFYVSDRPIAGALLAGLAAQQNPTVIAFFGFAPLIQLCLEWRAGAGLRANVAPALAPRRLLALGLGLAVAVLPVLFNLRLYGVPNVIATHHSDPHLIGMVRLVSFFFDLNQGMVVAIPALLLVLACWGWRAHGTRARALALAGACALFTLAMAVPALSVYNWNSDAAGVMRYAFWCAMPLLLIVLLRLRERAQWPRLLLATLMLAQALALANARSYHYLSLSPLAAAVLRIAPTHYHPEPEIFAERTAHNDSYIFPGKVYTYHVDERPVTTLFKAGDPAADTLLCGAGATLSPLNRSVPTADGWRYLHGEPICATGGVTQQRYSLAQFKTLGARLLVRGWNAPEGRGDGGWDGVWSEGAASQLVLALSPDWHPATLTLAGAYFDGQHRTRVRVNGVDLGWHVLDQGKPIALPAGTSGPVMTIDLAHETPATAPGPDPRNMSLFLRELTLR